MKREFRDYIKDILDALDKIEKFTEGIESFNDFMNDEKTALAVIKLLENTGEATKKYLNQLKADIPMHHGRKWLE